MREPMTIADVLQGYANWYHEHVSRGGWTNGSHVDGKRAREVARLAEMFTPAVAAAGEAVAWLIQRGEMVRFVCWTGDDLAYYEGCYGVKGIPLYAQPSAGAGVIPKHLREEWRAVRGDGMTSAVGEYTPREFWDLLDAYEALLAHPSAGASDAE